MSVSLQLDISGKLYLAPLTTVGGGWAGWLSGSLGGLCFTYLRPELAHVLTSVGTCPFAASVSALVQT